MCATPFMMVLENLTEILKFAKVLFLGYLPPWGRYTKPFVWHSSFIQFQETHHRNHWKGHAKHTPLFRDWYAEMLEFSSLFSCGKSRVLFFSSRTRTNMIFDQKRRLLELVLIFDKKPMFPVTLAWGMIRSTAEKHFQIFFAHACGARTDANRW